MMGKERENWQPVPPIRHVKKTRPNFWSHVLVMGSILLLCWYFAPAVDLRDFSHLGPIHKSLGVPVTCTDYAPSFKAEFGWDSVEPSTELDFVPCFKRENVTFQCAVLDVPMDWNAKVEEKEKRVHLAVIRLPAPVDITDEKYGGAILTNPGGPGGSGVSAVMNFGLGISKSVNTEEKYFDVISWDPRGVNNTKPRLSCFPDSLSADVFTLAQGTEGFGAEAIGPLWARTKALEMSCSEENDPEGMMAHMNTRVVVADMVAIIEGLGQWREKEALSILTREKMACEDRAEVISRTKWQKGKEKLLYWGFSYGTLLGATFAAMEPERVGRVILDGVVDSTDYYTNTWEKDLQNTDEIMDKFYEYCSQAGTSKCPLNSGNSTAKEIQETVEGLVEGLKEEPLSILGHQGPEIITYSDIRKLVLKALYSTLDQAPDVAELLADVVYGNGTKLAARKSEVNVPSCPLQCGEKKRSETECESPISSWEGMAGIMCSDGPDVSYRNLGWFKKSRERLLGQSKWMGEFWSTIPLSCVAWKGKAAWKITPDDIRGNTSHPILWIGNSLDPVTPLANAHTMAKKFPGSVVLEQDSEGHCCISSPSLCTARYIRNYFHTGELPPPGVVCQPEEKPFIGKTLSEEERVYLVEDMEMLAAMRDIGKGRRRDGPLSPF